MKQVLTLAMSDFFLGCLCVLFLFAGFSASAAETCPSRPALPENLALRATATADSEFGSGYGAAGACDANIPDSGRGGDVGRAWAVNGATHRNGATFTLTWPQAVPVQEVVYYGRTAFEAAECWKSYALYLDDALLPAASGEFAMGHGPQSIRLDQPRQAARLTLKFLSSHGGSNPGAAEIQVFPVAVDAGALPRFYPLQPGGTLEVSAEPPPDDSPETLPLLSKQLGVERLVLIHRHELTPTHVYTYHNEGFSAGGGLYVYDLASSAMTLLADSPKGQILDCDVSYDGREILFSWRSHGDDTYHVYCVREDGSDLHALTSGDWHDFNACWLPDGGIAFLSTRDARFAYCWDSPVATLHRMDGDGGNVRRLSPNIVNDFTPSVLGDGRILYSRWEYVDKPAIPIQSLWTIHPDGTALAGYFGNRVLSPATFMEGRAIPGTSRVMAVLTAHNGPPRGAVGIVDRTHGVNAADGITNLTPEVEIGQVDRGDGNQVRGPYESPYPLDEEWFLVSYRGSILFRNMEGDRIATVIQPVDGMGYYAPRPLRPRVRPPVLPSSLPPAEQAGPWASLFLQDVYQGLEPQVPRGVVKKIAVVQELEKRVRISPEKRAFGFQFPVISGGATYAAKKVWGYADVAQDGSARFLAPAGVPIYFMALDGQGRAVQRMRTFTHFMPGESQSCIGCHESRTGTTKPAMRAAALAEGAKPLTPPEWGVTEFGFDYSAIVQPVLDRHCVSCHGGALPEGGVDLCGDKTDFFNVSYETLARERQGAEGSPYVSWIPTYNGQEANILKVNPLDWGSPRSLLADLVLAGHPDESGQARISLSGDEQRRILTWIDLNVPYYSSAATEYPELEGSRRLYPENLDATLERVARDRCSDCHEAGKLPRKEWTRISRPELNTFLTAPLARAAGGSGKCGKPVFQSVDDPDYAAILKTFDPVLELLRQRPRLDMIAQR